MANKNNKNSKNESMNMSAANGNNTLCFTTYTSEKSGKTIPVVYGFTDKDDERLPYIAYVAVGEVKSEKRKVKNGKGQKVQRVHGPAYGTYSRLPLGKDGERISCVIWGADPRWHDIAKRAAEIINDLDALTQEDYDDLCAKAEAVYEARKKEGAAEVKSEGVKSEGVKSEGVKSEGVKSEGVKSEKSKGEKKKGSKVQEPTAQELTLTATKPAPAYTEAALMAAFAEVAKATKLSKESRTALENFMKAIIEKAKAA